MQAVFELPSKLATKERKRKENQLFTVHILAHCSSGNSQKVESRDVQEELQKFGAGLGEVQGGDADQGKEPQRPRAGLRAIPQQELHLAARPAHDRCGGERPIGPSQPHRNQRTPPLAL